MAGTQKNADSPAARRRTAMIAIAWFVRMRAAEKTPEDERRFLAWLAEDERHAAAYAGIEAVWDKTGGLETLPGLQVMRQKALHPRTGFLSRARRGGHRSAALWRPAGRVVWGVAGAGAAVAAAVMLTLTVPGLGPAAFKKAEQARSYETAVGQRSEITLADGSRVVMTSDSRLKAHFSAKERHVVLTRGQAYFSVAHDARRPFRVRAGSGTVTALGTEFDVYKKNGEVVVTLVDGSVEVAALRVPTERPRAHRLSAGQRVSYDKSGLSQVREVDIERAVAWRQGRIIVVDEPLLDVIDEMNRHSCRKLIVDRADSRLTDLLVTGQFRTGRPELLVQYIRAAGIGVWTAKDDRGNVVLRLRRSGRQG